MRDLSNALRILRKQPGFTFAAVLTLALGIGATTAIFSAVYGVLVRPLPVEQMNRIVVLQSDAPGLNLRRFPFNPASAYELNKRHELFEAVGGHEGREFTLSGFGEPQMVRVARTAGDLFGVLRAHPHLGRLYGADASQPASNRLPW